MFQKLRVIIFCILIALVFQAGCSAATQIPTALPLPTDTPLPPTATPLPPTDTPIPPTVTPDPAADLTVKAGLIDGMVDIGGRSLYIHCEGEESPTIILQSGEGMDTEDWKANSFFRNLSATTRTCAYDLANHGKSDSDPTPKTAQDLAGDLHTLLVNAKISGPYVLVGIGEGGWVTIMYAAQYTEDVVGMVLLDSAHLSDEASILYSALPTQSPDDSSQLVDFRDSMALEARINAKNGYIDNAKSIEQVSTVTSLGDLPLIVLIGLRGQPGLKDEINQLIFDVWVTLDKELAALSSNSQQISVEDTFFVLESQPNVVLRYIREIVEMVRG